MVQQKNLLLTSNLQLYYEVDLDRKLFNQFLHFVNIKNFSLFYFLMKEERDKDDPLRVQMDPSCFMYYLLIAKSLG